MLNSLWVLYTEADRENFQHERLLWKFKSQKMFLVTEYEALHAETQGQPQSISVCNLFLTVPIAKQN